MAEVFEVPVEEFNRRRDSALHGVAGRFLVRYAGLTQREAASKIGGISGDAISRQMCKVHGLLENDQRLRRLVQRAVERIAKLRQVTNKPRRGIQGGIEGSK